jgi:hypothetical protein
MPLLCCGHVLEVAVADLDDFTHDQFVECFADVIFAAVVVLANCE